jgi:predicted MFS family arabinose efflux permease
MVIWRSRRLRTNLLMAVLPMSVILMTLPNAYALALTVYKRGPEGFAAMEICTSIGWIAGGFLASRINWRGDQNAYTFCSLMCMATFLFGVGLSTNFWLSVGLLSFAAAANVGQIVGSMTLMQEVEERPDKGRIIAVRTGAGQLAVLVGFAAGGALGALVGVERLFLVAGSVGLVLAVAVYLPYWFGTRRVGLTVRSSEDSV